MYDIMKYLKYIPGFKEEFSVLNKKTQAAREAKDFNAYNKAWTEFTDKTQPMIDEWLKPKTPEELWLLDMERGEEYRRSWSKPA